MASTRHTSVVTLTSTDVEVLPPRLATLKGMLVANTHGSTNALVSIEDAAEVAKVSLPIVASTMAETPDWISGLQVFGIRLSLVAGPSSVIVTICYELDEEEPVVGPPVTWESYESVSVNKGRLSRQSERIKKDGTTTTR